MVKSRDLEVYKVGSVVKPIRFQNLVSRVIGWDTETFNGRVTLICNSRCKYAKINNISDLLKFLTSNSVHDKNFFFNLEYDANAIIKWLPEKNIREIAFFTSTVYWDKSMDIEYEITNLNRKLFQITKKLFKPNTRCLMSEPKKYDFYDIFQFYQLGSLEKTHGIIFPNKPYKKSLDASKEFPYEKISKEDIDYCIGDCIATKELADYFVYHTRKIIPVRKFYSPASLGKTLLNMHVIDSYKFQKSKTQAQALLAYNGGRFESQKIGKAKVYQYDINSAYPDATSKLPTIEGECKINADYEPEATHSFFNCDFIIPKDFKICPIRYEHKNLLLYPNGKFKDYHITKTEYELLKKLDIKIKINNAYHIFNSEPKYPYKFLEDVYKKRRDYKNSKKPSENALQLPLKLAMNSIYGIMIQATKKYKINDNYADEDITDTDNFTVSKCCKCGLQYKEDDKEFIGVCKCGSKEFDEQLLKPEIKAGAFFNPIIASEITANVRCKIFLDSFEHEDNIYMYATDSITTDKKLNLPISKELGDYTCTERLEGIIFGSGIYSLHNDKEHKVRFRGFGHNDVLELAKRNLKNSVITEIKKRPVKLKEALIQDDLGVESINVFKDFSKDFRLNFDEKRLWDRPAKDFQDLLENQIDSLPLNIQTHLTS
jgi:hypothetical protein